MCYHSSEPMIAHRTICRLAAPLAGAGLLASAGLPTPGPAPSVIPPPRAFSVITYLPDYRVAGLDPSACDSLTDVIYFSLEPTPAGGLDRARLTPAALAQLRALKQRSGIRLLVALGGWGRSQAFGPLAADPAARGRLVAALAQLCREDGLDGIDFDWEHPANAAEEEGYAALLAETKAAFQPHGWLVTVAMAAWQRLPAAGYAAVDRVHLMSYDHDGRHATVAAAQADIAQLVSRGVPCGKLCLGLPFYGRGITDRNRTLTYAEIVRQYHPPPESDEAGGLFFNGIRTIQQKTRCAQEEHLGGVMIWELGQDMTDDTSLLRAIHQVLACDAARP